MPTTKTALRNTCILTTPDPLINQAFQYAKDNMARTMRSYTLGWGMSNAPHAYTIVVGRDTGWMTLGTNAVAPWFAPQALAVFRDRQKPNGQILEYIDMETGDNDDYRLNIADNTPLYMWAVLRYWQQYQDADFRAGFMASMKAAADHLLAEIGSRGLLVSVPAGTAMWGITSWRNIIADTVIAGEVTEINALSAMALRCAAEFTCENHYASAADALENAINRHLWLDDHYLLKVDEDGADPQLTTDMIFPVLCGIAAEERSRTVLARLRQSDFWTARGLRTISTTDPAYDPARSFGLLGGVWPNPTLWYAAAAARFDADAALEALRAVAQPVVEGGFPNENLTTGDFAEWFRGDNLHNGGMPLSPWVAPTFVWAVLEGLLGLRWEAGMPHFTPHLPAGWESVTIEHLPCAHGFQDVEIR